MVHPDDATGENREYKVETRRYGGRCLPCFRVKKQPPDEGRAEARHRLYGLVLALLASLGLLRRVAGY